MSESDLWKKYCSFYEKPFSEQLEYNKQRMKEYFEKWKKTDLAKMLCKDTPQSYRDVPITTYSDYTMLSDFGDKIAKVIEENPRRPNELLYEYYMRVSPQAGSSLNRYMVEPFHFCAKSTGTTGVSKWVAYGETFAENLTQGTMATLLTCCSDGWGGTKLKEGDTAMNFSAPVPYISGWGANDFGKYFELVPPLKVTDNLQDMKRKFYLILKAIENGKQIHVAGGVGSMFYMIFKYIIEPEEFYEEYYKSMSLSLKKMLLLLKLLQCKLSGTQKRSITKYLPLKGVIIGGMDAQLYIDFFKKEFNLEPLNGFGSTEAGSLMKGDPDRKRDLVPNLVSSYFEFQTEDGDLKDIDQLKKGEVYSLVVTPFSSILYRYDIEDTFRVIDFRSDSMPIFAFEGRKKSIIDVYGYYRVTPYIIVQALSKAGLQMSDKWAVAKILEPKEHICFLMEKTWEYSEQEATKIIFDSLKEVHNDFRKYVVDFGIKDPSEAIKVEYLKLGAFQRYSAMKARMGSPLGQYKPPQLIPPDRMEIYESLKSA